MAQYRYIFFLIFFFAFETTNGQSYEISTLKKHKIAVFSPIYLDSAFSGKNYNHGKNFPRFTLQGIGFVQGAMIALNNFPIESCQIETFIYDSKSDSANIQNLIETNVLDDIEMIIASVKDRELVLLSKFCLRKKIPLISATFPNDAGISQNPFFVILNSTLKTHCESIFSYLLQTHTNEKIIHVRKSGNQEDRISNYFQNINKPDNKSLLNIKTISLDSNYSQIKNALDSTRLNIIIAGSLDESFAVEIYKILKTCLPKYKIQLIGMPNWDGFGAFSQKSNAKSSDFPIYYTSPYYNNKTDIFSSSIQSTYLKSYKGSPTESVFKGFESMYVFSRFLSEGQSLSGINLKSINVFSDFKIIPIKLNRESDQVDYFENKHLFFLKKQNGVTSKGW
jgi:ABC-type branched-subunit amino acid transport system substrate-binding protein